MSFLPQRYYHRIYLGFSIDVPNWLGKILDSAIEFLVRNLIGLLKSKGIDLPPGSAKILTEIISKGFDLVDQANEHTVVLRDQDSDFVDYQAYPLISVRHQFGFRDDEPDGSDGFNSIMCGFGHLSSPISYLLSRTFIAGSCDNNYEKIIDLYNEIKGAPGTSQSG